MSDSHSRTYSISSPYLSPDASFITSSSSSMFSAHSLLYSRYVSKHASTNQVLMYVQLIWHTPRLRRWLLACALIYAFDVLFRLLKTRICTATVIAPTSSSQTIIINIPGLGSGWRAGQHVRIRVLSKGLGGLRWSEAHPLTIAGPPRAPDGSGMTLLLKKAGAWSRGLHNLALAAGNMGYDRESRYT